MGWEAILRQQNPPPFSNFQEFHSILQQKWPETMDSANRKEHYEETMQNIKEFHALRQAFRKFRLPVRVLKTLVQTVLDPMHAPVLNGTDYSLMRSCFEQADVLHSKSAIMHQEYTQTVAQFTQTMAHPDCTFRGYMLELIEVYQSMLAALSEEYRGLNTKMEGAHQIDSTFRQHRDLMITKGGVPMKGGVDMTPRYMATIRAKLMKIEKELGIDNIAVPKTSNVSPRKNHDDSLLEDMRAAMNPNSLPDWWYRM